MTNSKTPGVLDPKYLGQASAVQVDFEFGAHAFEHGQPASGTPRLSTQHTRSSRLHTCIPSANLSAGHQALTPAHLSTHTRISVPCASIERT